MRWAMRLGLRMATPKVKLKVMPMGTRMETGLETPMAMRLAKEIRSLTEKLKDWRKGIHLAIPTD